MQWPNAMKSAESICKKEVLQLCNETMFPNMHSFLKAGSTLPITVASIERSFSTLKRLKIVYKVRPEKNRLNRASSIIYPQRNSSKC